MTGDQGRLALPGLDDVDDLEQLRRAGPVSDLERAIRRTLAALHADGHIGEVDAGKLQLAIEMAQVIEMKKTTRRASTIGNDARVLMEILDAFVDEASDVDDVLRAAMDEWSEEFGRPPAPTDQR